MPEAPMAPAAAGPGGDGGGVAEAIAGLDAGLSKLAKITIENPKIPDGAKASLQAAVDAFRAFTSELGGGGEGDAASAPAQAGPGGGTLPAMGGAAGVPMSHGRPA